MALTRITSDGITDAAIVNADINASAAIAGTKISPTFTSNVTISNSVPKLLLTDTGNNPDYDLRNQDGAFVIHDTTNSANRLIVQSDGHLDIAGNVDFGAGIDVTGAITGTGDLTIDTNTLHVDSSNNRVGIGTTSPSVKTQISVADTTAYSASTISANQFQLSITNTGAAGVAGILLATEPSSGNGGHCGIRALSTGNGDSALTISTRGSSTSAERLRIESSGDVIVKTGHLNLENATATNSRHFSITNASGSTGWTFGNGVTASAHQFVIYDNTAGAARMLINSSGNVGISTTSPAAKLDIGGLTNTGGQNVDALKITRTDGLQLFGINWNVSANEVSFSGNTKNYVFKNKSSSAESIRFPATGGITFNGDTAAANALDDYEEGTWTVGNVSGVGGSGTVVNTSSYVKIGKIVHITLNIFSNSNNMSFSSVSLSGLPYTVKDHQGIFVGGYNNKDSSGAYINSTNIIIMSGGSGIRHVWTHFSYEIA